MDTALLQRLDRIEAAVQELLRQRTVKDFYTTAEAAVILRRAEYTVREWCRHGQAQASKRRTGHGVSKEWIIPHAELVRLGNEGPAALGTFWEQNGPHKPHSTATHSPRG